MKNYNTDTLICGVCKGKKLIINESTKKAEICPKCHGTGRLDEISSQPKKTLLKVIRGDLGSIGDVYR